MRAVAQAAACVLIGALALPAAAPARETAATLPAAPFGPATEMALAGGRVVWEEPVRGANPRDRELTPVRVRIAGPGEEPRTLVTFPAVTTTHPHGYQLAKIQASATDVAVTRVAVGVTPTGRTTVDNEVHVDELWAGPVDGPLRRIAACEPGAEHPALHYNFDVSAGRVVSETCDGGRDIVVHDLGSGAERRIVRGGAAGQHVSLAGRHLAWEERDEAGFERTLVVHDLEAAADVRRIEQPRTETLHNRPFYVQDDGRLLDPHFSRGFTTGVPLVYSPGGDDRTLRSMSVTRLSNDRTLETHAYGQRADLTVNGIDGTRIPVARVDSSRLGQTDLDGDRVAWGEQQCGATKLYVQRVGEPFSVSRSMLENRCARVSLPARASVKGGALRLPLRCVEMRRCAGRVKLAAGDGARLLSRTFNYGRASRGVLRARLATGGATAALATVYDRDGFILARRTIALRP